MTRMFYEKCYQVAVDLADALESDNGQMFAKQRGALDPKGARTGFEVMVTVLTAAIHNDCYDKPGKLAKLRVRVEDIAFGDETADPVRSEYPTVQLVLGAFF